jgi:hypothetical protein
MAKSKKIKELVIQRPTEIMMEPSLTLNANQTFKDCEWCFQFDDNEPHVFAATKPSYEGDNAKITFTLTNQTNTNIVFTDSKTGKEFKLFVREKI